MTTLLISYMRVVITALVLGGCATYGQEKLFEDGKGLPQSVISGTKETASVYILRERGWLQSIQLIPIPPMAYAVDKKMTTILPLGAYVHLQLPPGPHTFTKLVIRDNIFSIDVDQTDLVVTLEAGRTYFVATRNAIPGPTFALIDDAKGEEILKENVLAKIIYAPTTVDTFVERIRNRGGGKPKQSASAEKFQIADFLPSQQQISGFFEGVATVALIALIIVGAGAATATSSPLPAMSSHDLIPPAIYRSSGSKTQVIKENDETRVRNWDTGITYTIKENAIVGSDGSRYRVSGNNIYSSTGEYYQRIGNQIFGNDGSSCVLLGSNLDCKRK